MRNRIMVMYCAIYKYVHVSGRCTLHFLQAMCVTFIRESGDYMYVIEHQAEVMNALTSYKYNCKWKDITTRIIRFNTVWVQTFPFRYILFCMQRFSFLLPASIKIFVSDFTRSFAQYFRCSSGLTWRHKERKMSFRELLKSRTFFIKLPHSEVHEMAFPFQVTVRGWF